MSTLISSLNNYAPANHSITQISKPSLSFKTHYLRTQFHFRSNKEARVAVKQRLTLVFASTKNVSEASDDVKANDSTAQGPPFLTILAGLVVFSGICCIIGSVVMWVVGLTVHPPPLK